MDLKNRKVTIIGERISLRVLEDKYATQKYCDWLNDHDVNKFLETKDVTIDEIKEYIADKNESPDCLFFGIFLNESGEHLGNLKLDQIDFKKETAEFGILIGEKRYWSKGIGTEATQLIVDWAFNTLKLKEIKLGVISDNKGAVRAYEKVGFKVDSVKKKSVKIDDDYYDTIKMSIKK